MTSGEAHCDQELAADVRRGSLGPAREKEEEGEGRRKEKEGEGRRSRATNIKSKNPHLAGGELFMCMCRLHIYIDIFFTYIIK